MLKLTIPARARPVRAAGRASAGAAGGRACPAATAAPRPAAELARNRGMIASFSRALLEDLRHQMSDEEFDRCARRGDRRNLSRLDQEGVGRSWCARFAAAATGRARSGREPALRAVRRLHRDACGARTEASGKAAFLAATPGPPWQRSGAEPLPAGCPGFVMRSRATGRRDNVMAAHLRPGPFLLTIPAGPRCRRRASVCSGPGPPAPAPPASARSPCCPSRPPAPSCPGPA